MAGKEGTGFSNDGSFLDQFMKQYAKPSPAQPPAEDDRSREERLRARREAERHEREEKRRELERKRQEYDEEQQRKRIEMEAERAKREQMVQNLLDQQKQEAAKLHSQPQAAAKPRKQPFVSKSAPSTHLKRKAAAPRSKPAMPVIKKQRVAPPPPTYRAPAVLAAPKPPRGTLKTLADELALQVVENGPACQEEALQRPQYSFLRDPESEAFKYYEYKKEQICEARGIVLQRGGLDQSDSIKAMNETLEVLSVKYKHIEEKLEREEQAEQDRAREQLAGVVQREQLASEGNQEFLKQLSSHYTGQPQPDEAPEVPYNPLLSSDNKGHLLMRGMGWTDGMGLGASNSGRVAPVEAVARTSNMGLGADTAEEEKANSDIFTAFQKRLRTQYQHRPNSRKRH